MTKQLNNLSNATSKKEIERAHLQVSFKIHCLFSAAILAKEKCLFCRTNKTCRSGSGYKPLATRQTDTKR